MSFVESLFPHWMHNGGILIHALVMTKRYAMLMHTLRKQTFDDDQLIVCSNSICLDIVCVGTFCLDIVCLSTFYSNMVCSDMVCLTIVNPNLSWIVLYVFLAEHSLTKHPCLEMLWSPTIAPIFLVELDEAKRVR